MMKAKRSFKIIGVSTLMTLVLHYLLISNIRISSTIQIAIDFLLFWIIITIICLPGIMKNRKFRKKKKFSLEDYIGYIAVFPVLVIHHFLISKININSTFQLVIDFAVFWFILIIFFVIEGLAEGLKQKRNSKV